MNHTTIDHWVHQLIELTAKELYNFALNVYGNETEAIAASVDAFVHAFVNVTYDNNVLDAIMFKSLNIRFLYIYGKKRKKILNKRKKALTSKQDHQAVLADKNEFFNKLNQLNYRERFILLLFCYQKMKIEHISQVLQLPKFLVARRLLSAARKMSIFDHVNNITYAGLIN
jgi:DNA-directed RNA polymerase specialized sigma24 family protein